MYDSFKIQSVLLMIHLQGPPRLTSTKSRPPLNHSLEESNVPNNCVKSVSQSTRSFRIPAVKLCIYNHVISTVFITSATQLDIIRVFGVINA